MSDNIKVNPQAWPFRDANTGVSQDFTGLAAVVQLRLRVVFASVVKLPSCSASNGESAGGSPAGCATFIYDFRFTIYDFKRRVVCLEQQRGWSQKP